MERLDLFSNLVALASADGRVTQQEIEYLAIKADQWGISSDDAEAVLIGLQEGGLEVEIPAEYDDRRELMAEMISMMAIDGDLAENEKRLCAAASAAMEFTPHEFNEILDQLLRQANND